MTSKVWELGAWVGTDGADFVTQAELDAKVSDTAYGAGWNADTTTAASKNALYDEMELRLPRSWVKSVRKSADESVTSATTLQNDDELTFAIAANEVWVVRYLVVYVGDTSGDIQVAVDGPSGSTVVASCWGIDTPGVSNIGSLKINIGADGASMGGRGAYASQLSLFVEASILNGANAGNVALQWTEDAASGTLTVKAGSSLLAVRVA